MFEHIHLKGNSIKPALFLAPMSGISHSAFRRLVSDFGGYGALFTEMLSGISLLHENLSTSPYVIKRDCEKKVFYQLLLSGDENINAILNKISTVLPAGIDLNLGCPAPKIKKLKAGAALFQDSERLNSVLVSLRKYWSGILTIKCRLGDNAKNWKTEFKERLKIFESNRVDAIIVHPRFSKDKLKRRARWEHFPWIAEQTALPIIGNGDILSVRQFKENRALFSPLAGLMIGRLAAVKPWIFREFYNEIFSPAQKDSLAPVNYTEVWKRLYKYTLEDFPPEKAIGRIKEFSTYFARNFFFGHEFYSAVQGSKSLEEVYDSAMAFLNNNPKVSKHISVAGI